MFIRGPMNLHGEEANVDVMVEAKAKEHTVMEFRKLAGLDVKLPKVGLVMRWRGNRGTKKASGMAAGGLCASPSGRRRVSGAAHPLRSARPPGLNVELLKGCIPALCPVGGLSDIELLTTDCYVSQLGQVDK